MGVGEQSRTADSGLSTGGKWCWMLPCGHGGGTVDLEAEVEGLPNQESYVLCIWQKQSSPCLNF